MKNTWLLETKEECALHEPLTLPGIVVGALVLFFLCGCSEELMSGPQPTYTVLEDGMMRTTNKQPLPNEAIGYHGWAPLQDVPHIGGRWLARQKAARIAEMTRVMAAREAKRILLEEQKAAQVKIRREKAASVPGLSDRIAECILAGKITLGMTCEQTIASWGVPDQKNRSVGSWGIHEQWVYVQMYLYFENGILTSWQD